MYYNSKDYLKTEYTNEIDMGERQQSTEIERPLAIGEVRLLREESVVDRHGHEHIRRDVAVGDQSDADPALREWYRQKGNEAEQMLRSNPQWAKTVVENGFAFISLDNEAAKWLYFDEHGNNTQMMRWAGGFPTAVALRPLQIPGVGEYALGYDEEPLDARTSELFTNMSDGIALRSRGGIYGNILSQYATKQHTDQLDIISLGSGAAVPNTQATRLLEAEGVATNWRFFDFDPNALKFARKLIGREDFSLSSFDYGPLAESGEPLGQNYLRAFGVEDGSVDVVDALGLWEYLKPAHAERFANKLYAKLKPGGKMTVSNMLPSRPHRELNERAVGWPGLYLRSDTDLLDIVAAAGIDTRNVTMTHARDGVYVVMEINKPL